MDDNCLTRAISIVQQRGVQYGHPFDVYMKTAYILTGVLRDKLLPGATLTPEDVARIQLGLKLGRESGKHLQDNVDDICGYAWVLEEIINERERREEANESRSGAVPELHSTPAGAQDLGHSQLP